MLRRCRFAMALRAAPTALRRPRVERRRFRARSFPGFLASQATFAFALPASTATIRLQAARRGATFRSRVASRVSSATSSRSSAVSPSRILRAHRISCRFCIFRLRLSSCRKGTVAFFIRAIARFRRSCRKRCPRWDSDHRTNERLLVRARPSQRLDVDPDGLQPAVEVRVAEAERLHRLLQVAAELADEAQ